MKIRTEKVIDIDEWDKLVEETYSRPYNLQQQNGCHSRGTFPLKVPSEAEDYDVDTIPEVINGPNMGVSLASWLQRDPKAPVGEDSTEWRVRLWWERNFYPNIHMIANDLHHRGLLESGDYSIIIDW